MPLEPLRAQSTRRLTDDMRSSPFVMNGSPPKILELVVSIVSGKPSNDVGIGDSNSTGMSGNCYG